MKLTFKYLFALTLILTSVNSAFCQRLRIGQYVPNVIIGNVLNHESSQINLADYKGKFIILDFWSFHCVSCLESFSELDSIQHAFGNRLQIILVNMEGPEKTKEFFRKRSKLRIPSSVPLITSDSFLKKLFPHSGVPHSIWIDSSGKICYKNDHIIAADVAGFLRGDKLNLSDAGLRRDVSSFFNKDFENRITYARYISRGNDTTNEYINVSNDNIPYRCRSIEELYQFAYNESDIEAFYRFREPGRTILQVADVSNYRLEHGINNDEWRKKYGYYYHAILPDALNKYRYKFMREDLHNYFGLDARIEKRKVKCLVLIRTSRKDKLKTKGGAPQQTNFLIDLRLSDDDPGAAKVRFIRNKPFSVLFEELKASYGDGTFGVKVIDSTGYSGNIDFEMKEEVLQNMTVASLRKELNRYDLDLVERSILMKVLVLREKNKKQGH
jgi:thiol-disulfide isomerase/thioredoxin